MKKLLTSIAVVALIASPAVAFNSNLNTNTNANTNLNTQGQTQGQGQAQGQLQGQGQGQGQAQSNRNNVTVEGGVSTSVGASACANAISLGVPGVAGLGASWSSQDCRKFMAAELLYKSGAISKADLLTIVMSANAMQGLKVVAPAAPAAPAPVKAHYAKCEKEASGRLKVTMARGGDQATAVAQCKAAMR